MIGQTESRGPTDVVANGVDTAKRRLMQSLPDGVKRRLVGPYNRVLTTKANREYRRRQQTLLSRTPASDAPDHVVCVVVDALRVDAVTPDDSPFLHARLQRDLITPAPWTFPAVSSLVTGEYPHEHGAIRQSDDSDTGSTDLVIPPKLSEERATLSDVFGSAGYDTYGGFAFHMPFFAIGGRFGNHAVYDKADADTVLDDYREWLTGDDHDRTFSYLHLGDLHEPVDPPASYWDRYDVDRQVPDITTWDYTDVDDPGPDGERYREHRLRLYRAALAFVDDRLEALHGDLSHELDGDVALLVTGDHGEAFWEHAAFDAAHFVDSRPAYCVDHGGTPYESLTRVPLAVDGFDIPTDDGLASLVDLAPTLLDAAGLTAALETTGVSLHSGVPADRIALVESARYGHEKKSAYVDEWKLVVSRGDDESVGFRLPDETPADLPMDVEHRLTEALPAWPNGEHADIRVSGMAQERLEDLGYV